MNILIVLSLLHVCLYASAQAVIDAENDSEISGGGGFSEERVKELLDDSLALVPTEPTGSFMTIFKPRNNYWQLNCTTSSSNFTCGVQVANLRATVQTTTQRVVYLISGLSFELTGEIHSAPNIRLKRTRSYSAQNISTLSSTGSPITRNILARILQNYNDLLSENYIG